MKTRFNLTRQHVINIRTLLNGYTDGAVVVPGKDIVIIHGSGQMFACNDNELVKSRDDDGRIIIIPAALAGSNHHKQYNSGYDQSREAAGVAAYRAIYRKGDKLPESVVDIENKMTDQAFADIKIGLAKPEFKPSNILKTTDEVLPGEDVPEVKEQEKPKPAVKPKGRKS